MVNWLKSIHLPLLGLMMDWAKLPESLGTCREWGYNRELSLVEESSSLEVSANSTVFQVPGQPVGCAVAVSLLVAPQRAAATKNHVAFSFAVVCVVSTKKQNRIA